MMFTLTFAMFYPLIHFWYFQTVINTLLFRHSSLINRPKNMPFKMLWMVKWSTCSFSKRWKGTGIPTYMVIDVDTCAINLLNTLVLYKFTSSSYLRSYNIYNILLMQIKVDWNFKEKSCHNNYKLQSYFKYHRRPPCNSKK